MRKILHTGRVFKLISQEIKLPSKRISTFEIIEHRGAVLLIPFLSKNRVIMLRQYRPAIDSYIYELPAGTIEENEKPLATARREIIEEIGYKARFVKKIGFIYLAPGYSTEKIIVYTANDLSKAFADKDEDEIITACEFTKSQIRDLFKNGKIVDAKTISAFAMCGWL